MPRPLDVRILVSTFKHSLIFKLQAFLNLIPQVISSFDCDVVQIRTLDGQRTFASCSIGAYSRYTVCTYPRCTTSSVAPNMRCSAPDLMRGRRCYVSLTIAYSSRLVWTEPALPPGIVFATNLMPDVFKESTTRTAPVDETKPDGMSHTILPVFPPPCTTSPAVPIIIWSISVKLSEALIQAPNRRQ
ncbi:hypothetical protein B0H14DRAFT_3898108 [Mycena olivaceomarginata]|nr:hypothetical protein B0H14DRAFT_3898108 [Mycena olivaceomarginata]